MKSAVVYCNCSWWNTIPDDTREKVLEYLKASETVFCAADDLCRIAAKDTALLKEFADADKLTVIACFPRAVKSLFAAAGTELPADTAILNMRELSADEIIAKLNVVNDPADADPFPTGKNIQKQGEWVPWYPVIDPDRCVNCMQCLNFCLFGVYEIGEDGNICVARPANCKTNCPACARVCPHAAIIFPKYNDAPINGDQVDEEALKNADKSNALADLMEGDVHEIIRSRSAQRKRFAPNSSADMSNTDKASKLDALKQKLDIPQDVIDSLMDGNSKNDGKCPNSDFCDKECEGKIDND